MAISAKCKVQILKYTVVRTITYNLQEFFYFFLCIYYSISFFVSFAWYVKNDKIIVNYFT